MSASSPARARQILSRLRRLHAGASRRRRRAQWSDDCIVEMRETYKRRRDVMVKVFGPPAGNTAAAGVDVRLGAAARTVPRTRQRRNSRRFWSRTPASRWRPVSASASTARFYPSCPGRERAAHPPGGAHIRRFLETGPEKLHNVVLSPSDADCKCLLCYQSWTFMITPLKVGIAGLARWVPPYCVSFARIRRVRRPMRAAVEVVAFCARM